MARGGGGGGRGGGGRGGSRGRSHGYNSVSWDQMSPLERIMFVFFLGAVMLLSFFMEMEDTGRMYDEGQLESFTSAQYDLAFSDTAAYEDNLLLSLLVYEDRGDFAYMTWVGDHIRDDAFAYLRGEGTWLDTMRITAAPSQRTSPGLSGSWRTRSLRRRNMAPTPALRAPTTAPPVF